MLMKLAKKLHCNVMPMVGSKFTISVKEHSCMPMVLTIVDTDCLLPTIYPTITKAHYCPIILDVQSGESPYVLLSEPKP